MSKIKLPWSYNRIKWQERCPYAIKLELIDKVSTSAFDPTDRGKKIHKHLEDFLYGRTSEKLPDIHLDWNHLEWVKENTIDLLVQGEQQWGFREDWSAGNFFSKDIWGRVVIDLLYFPLDGETAVIEDYKTGKKDEIKHTEQLLFYAVATWKKYPQIENFVGRIRYLDSKKNNVLERKWTAANLKKVLPMIERRANNYVNATEFPAKPSKLCTYCAVKTHCKYKHPETN